MSDYPWRVATQSAGDFRIRRGAKEAFLVRSPWFVAGIHFADPALASLNPNRLESATESLGDLDVRNLTEKSVLL